MSVKKQNPEISALEQSPSLKNWGEPHALPKENVYIQCGWGHLLFGHTFKSQDDIVELMSKEEEGSRDLALYIRDPQVVLAKAPQDLFIDPSYTYRLALEKYEPLKDKPDTFSIRPLDTDSESDIEEINRIYLAHKMVPVDPEFLKKPEDHVAIKYWVAVDNDTDDIISVCMGIDHKQAFDDPENGSSLWSLAVDPQAKHARVGLQMVQNLAEFFKKERRSFLDLSVLHSNAGAIALYKKLGFEQIPVFCIKNKNAYNENLFLGPDLERGLNPYSMIIINEARRRGIRVDILDPVDNYFKLSTGGRNVTCRESLSAMTSSIAMSRCSDKRTTVRLLRHAGLNVPAQQVAATPYKNMEFLKKHKTIVVKPADRDYGLGLSLNVSTDNELVNALDKAYKVSHKVVLQEMIEGEHLRIVIIDYEVAAAAIRKPPIIVGDGEHTILDLIKKQSRRREQATQGESRIIIDEELRHTINGAGYSLDDILKKGVELQVRQWASLHQGGTLHDVTDILHPELAAAAREAARTLHIPVVGLDFIVNSAEEPQYVIIQANERPGLANHEPQPTAEKFIDFLFPQSIGRANNDGEVPDKAIEDKKN
ncbi:MAG: N-acetylglutaminylglutamine synthetase [Alphaproteobacteria bacterium]|nr:N-acetylglutaminylglutamine synthetase [Alphaproteobacteria bacterium]